MKDLLGNRIYREDIGRSLRQTVSLAKLKGTKVLVTGATGTVGSFIATMLAMSGLDVEVYALGRSKQRLDGLFSALDNVIPVEQDLREDLSFTFCADYIIHAAGNAYPAAFSSDPAGTLLDYVLATDRLLKYAMFSGTKRFLFISSGEVYGKITDENGEFREDMAGAANPSLPRSCYPIGKLAAENLAASYTAMYGLETVSARLCHTYGPVFSGKDNRAVAQFLSNALKGEPIVLRSQGLPYRSYCYAADTASAVLTVLLEGKSGEAYNIANPDSRTTIRGLAEQVAALSGTKVVFDIPEGEGNQTTRNQILNTMKLEALGWHGSYTMEEGLSRTLEILRDTMR